MKKIVKQITAVCVSLVMAISAACISVSAEKLTDSDNILTESMSRSASLPNANDVWDLSTDDYTGTIESMYYSIYTNYWFSGKNSISVSLSGDSMYDYLENTNPNIERNVTIFLYKKDTIGTILIDSKAISSKAPQSYFSKVFSNLDKNAKYVVRVTKTNDGMEVTDLELKVW